MLIYNVIETAPPDAEKHAPDSRHPMPRAAYVRAETSAEASFFAEKKLGFTYAEANSIDVNLLPANSKVHTAPPMPHPEPVAAPSQPLLMTNPIFTIAAGVFLGLLAFAIFGFLLNLIFAFSFKKP